MPKQSAGLILYRRRGAEFQVLLAHPGGPFYTRKDLGAWSIPKGEPDPGEDLLAAARREVEEELGFKPDGEFVSLGSITQKSGKVVYAWAIEGDWDPSLIRSNSFAIEWPPHSGKQQEFPEVDRAEFFSLAEACRRINPAQAELLTRLRQLLAAS
ncbi:MAG TPA: NUDIX domain-containing protein [Terriglobia bacterium]|nr:NUDIX domain-containing protein [Terriglobia bacterium]